MRFAVMYFWEFVQNLPLVTGMMLALQWWQESQLFLAVTAMLAGSILGATLIRLTETYILYGGRPGETIVEGAEKRSAEREPLAVTLTNMVIMFLIMLMLTLYLTAGWSSWLTDLLVGGLVGFTLSAAQSKAANEPVVLRHSLAFAAAFPVAILIIRFLSTALPIVAGIFLITTVITLIITQIDYGHLSTVSKGVN
jgi:hypothetical protein